MQQSINILLAAMFCHTLSPRLTVVVRETSSTDLGSRGEIGGACRTLSLWWSRGEKAGGGAASATKIDALHASPIRRPSAQPAIRSLILINYQATQDPAMARNTLSDLRAISMGLSYISCGHCLAGVGVLATLAVAGVIGTARRRGPLPRAVRTPLLLTERPSTASMSRARGSFMAPIIIRPLPP